MTFQRYNKYEVMKIDDIKKYLNDDQKAVLDGIIETIHEGRTQDGKPACNSYVVVNEEEPYVEEVWDLVEMWEAYRNIEKKVTGDRELDDFFGRWVL